ncbi:MAG: hypothetical protein ACI814_003468 [Mariniblastus sp.]|jgi:hypothetical protein
MTASKSILACLLVFCCVPLLNAQQIKVGPPQLEIAKCSTFELQWNDRGSGADTDGAFWRPVKSGFYPVGDLVVDNYEDANDQRGVLVVKDGVAGATRKPVDYKRVWAESGSGADQKGSIWQPIPPQGYVAMGCVAQSGHDKPDTNAIRCIRQDLVTRGEISDVVWSDKGSGAQEDVSSHVVLNLDDKSTAPEAFVTSDKYSNPSNHPCAYAFSSKAKSRELQVKKGVLVLKVFEITAINNPEDRQISFELHKVAKDFTVSFAENYEKRPLPPAGEELNGFKATIEVALSSNTNPQEVSSKLEKNNRVEEIDGNRKTWKATILVNGFLETGNDYRVLTIRDGGLHTFGLSGAVSFQSYEYGSIPASAR